MESLVWQLQKPQRAARSTRIRIDLAKIGSNIEIRCISVH